MIGDIRPLPDPPRCRGIPLGNGDYTGCAFGYGDVPPFTLRYYCPLCRGSGIEGGVIGTALPHAEFGDPDCCGCLKGILRKNQQAAIVCNECGAVVRTVPSAELQKTLDEMELTWRSPVPSARTAAR